MLNDHPLSAEPLIKTLAENLRAFLIERDRADSPIIIGIHTGGVWVAEKLHDALRPGTPLGTLNINFYRDDFSQIGLHPRIGPSNIPISIDNRHVVLVDDVLHTGRTIRAALNEMFDYGRAASVTLAILVDREDRELPICADARGKTLRLAAEQNIKLYGPDPLELKLSKES